jgi:hypothetical protein
MRGVAERNPEFTLTLRAFSAFACLEILDMQFVFTVMAMKTDSHPIAPLCLLIFGDIC